MRTEVQTHQCRCWTDSDGRCWVDVDPDSPYCESCDSRHAEGHIPVFHVDFTGEVVPG